MNTPLDLEWLARAGSEWVAAQRDRYRPLGRPFLPHEIAVLNGFYDEGTLTSVRIHVVSQIENPSFYSVIPQNVRDGLIDFTAMAGITFDNTIVVASAVSDAQVVDLRLLFHELVHVVQYRLLGVDGFIGEYVSGWAQNGFQYMGIPLEREAYALDARFSAEPSASFSVEVEILRAHAGQNL